MDVLDYNPPYVQSDFTCNPGPTDIFSLQLRHPSGGVAKQLNREKSVGIVRAVSSERF